MAVAMDPSTVSAADLQNPQISPADLGLLAQYRRDLWPAILSHPQCYPALGQWIQQQMSQVPPQPEPMNPTEAEHSAGADPSMQQTASSGQPPSAGYRQSSSGGHGQSPSAGLGTPAGHPTQSGSPAQSGYPVQSGSPAQTGFPTQPGYPVQPEQSAQAAPPSTGAHQPGTGSQQMKESAQSFAAGMKSFTNDQLAPAAKTATSDFKTAFNESRGQGWKAWAPFAIIAFGLLIVISVFLPLVHASASGFGVRVSATCSYFYCGAMGDSDDQAAMAFLGVLTLLAGAIPATLGFMAIAKRKAGLRVAASVLAILVALYGLVLSISYLSSLGDSSGFGVSANPGIGTILLLIASIGLGAAGIVTILPEVAKTRAEAQAADSGAPLQQPQSPGAASQPSYGAAPTSTGAANMPAPPQQPQAPQQPESTPPQPQQPPAAPPSRQQPPQHGDQG